MPKRVMYIYGLLMVLLMPISAHASDVVRQYIPTAEVVGEGRLTFLFWDAYDAVLYAPEGEWQPNQPFALTLHYLRQINGEDIADRSIEEMRKLGLSDEVMMAAWHAQMRAIFPDVDNGTRLTGISQPGKPTRFYKGDVFIGEVKDPAFGEYFFNIWLSEHTSEPALRQTLLGNL